MRKLSTLLLAVLVAASLAGATAQAAAPGDQQGVARFDHRLRYEAVKLIYLPQLDKCFVAWIDVDAGGLTEIACSDDFKALARPARFPDPTE